MGLKDEEMKAPVFYKEFSETHLAKKKKDMHDMIDQLTKMGYTEDADTSKFDNINAVGLLKMLKSEDPEKRVKPIEILAHLFYKTCRIDLETNAVLDFLPKSIETAIEYEKAGFDDPKKPLFGLPISVKDTYCMEGYPMTYGYIAHMKDRIAKRDCLQVQVLKEMGAIPFVRSTIPETCATYVAENLIIGRTQHPRAFFDKEKKLKQRSPGGSSSGEGVLVKLGGSVLGFGSDGAGSIRIPSAFCGFPGLRQSSHRTTHKTKNEFESHEYSFNGPDMLVEGAMANNVETIAYVYKHLFAHPTILKEDQFVVPLPFNESEFNVEGKKFKFGYFWSHTDIGEIGYLKRSVMAAVEALKKEGHECVDISDKIPNFYDAYYKLFLKLTCIDGGRSIYNAFVAGKGQIKEMEPMKQLVSISRINRKMALLGVKITDPDMLTRATNLSKSLSAEEYLGLIENGLQKFKDEVGELMASNNFDSLICPFWEGPAELTDEPNQNAGIFTCVTSLMSFPCMSVPVVKITQQDVDDLKSTMKERESKNGVLGFSEQSLLKSVDEDAIDLPLSIQLVGVPFSDEKLLGIASILEKTLAHSII